MHRMRQINFCFAVNVDQEALSEEQLEHFTNVVQFNTYNILKQRIYNWQPIIFTHYTGLQYLFARAAAEYAVISQIFNEIKVRENFMPSTLFDFGSGVGTVVWLVIERNLLISLKYRGWMAIFCCKGLNQ